MGHNMVVLWNGRTVKQSGWWFCLIQIKHYSSRGPIALWLCILHVHLCRDCETVPELHWNEPGTISQSQCTPPQCKQIIFGIKNENEVQGQSRPKLIRILTVLNAFWSKFGNPNLNRWGVMVWARSKWGQFCVWSSIWPWRSRSFPPPPKIIVILTKVFYTFGPNLVILAWTSPEFSRGQTSDWHRLTDTQMQATTIPVVQNWPRVKKKKNSFRKTSQM